MNELDKLIAEKGIDLVTDLVKAIVKPSFEELGELFADKVKYWRLKNQLKILLKTKELISECKKEIQTIPVKSFVNFLEYASLEDDESMQDKWARLLFTATTSENNFNESLTYIEILNQLSSQEVVVLDKLFNEFKKKGFVQLNEVYNFNTPYLFKYNITSELEFSTYIADVIFGNLYRLNLIKYEPRPSTFGQKEYVNEENVAFTPLGLGLLRSCNSEYSAPSESLKKDSDE